jgi:allophanate hydrolase subunit 2
MAILAPGLAVRVGSAAGRGLAAGVLTEGASFEVKGPGAWVQLMIGEEGATLARDLPSLPTHLAVQALGEPWEAWVEVSSQSSREGIRLAGGDVARPALARSEPAIRGLIQAPSPGVLLVHGPEGPTTGGYGRAGVLDDLALTQLAAKPPGSQFLLRAREDSPPQSELVFRSLIEGVFG